MNKSALLLALVTAAMVRDDVTILGDIKPRKAKVLTEKDHERIRLAEEKRQRKNLNRSKGKI